MDKSNDKFSDGDHFTELIDLIRNQIGEHEMSITMNTQIENDLGVSGDDASDLINILSKKFQFNIENFNFSKYFNDEPSIFGTGRIVVPFTVGHLLKAVNAGRLDEEIINN